MCGRFINDFNLDEIIDVFRVKEILGDYSTSYNVAPGQKIPVILNDGEKNILDAFKWGLIPQWAKDPKIGYKMINARSETIAEKPSFKNAFKNRRCLIVSNGFFEWKMEDGGKMPYLIFLKDRKLFGFASIWEQWQSSNGDIIKSCSIITAEANEFMKPIHHRMPVILPVETEQDWLNPENQDIQSLIDMLKPYPAELMQAFKVSKLVNSPRNNVKECLLPFDENDEP